MRGLLLCAWCHLSIGVLCLAIALIVSVVFDTLDPTVLMAPTRAMLVQESQIEIEGVRIEPTWNFFATMTEPTQASELENYCPNDFIDSVTDPDDMRLTANVLVLRVAKQPTYNTCIQQGGRKTVSGLEIEVLEVAADWIQNDDPAKEDTPIHEILVTTDKPWWGDFLVAVPLFFTTLAGVFLEPVMNFFIGVPRWGGRL